LNADAVTGQYNAEITWNEADTFNKASGGGFSKYDTLPSYQNVVTGQTTGRAVPDLAFNASINGGVLVYQTQTSSKNPPVTVIGGTSVGTPEMAGLIADGVQMAGHRLGLLNPALYQLGQSKNYPQLMHDINFGNNILRASDIPGYAARQGWDAATGWGSPKQAEPFLHALIGLPLNPPVNTPTSPPKNPPVNTPVSTPITLPVKTPISTPISMPVSTPVKTPVRTPTSTAVILPTPMHQAKISSP
ncbi:MAG: hypothetical protein ACRDHW_17230, partial [Ktedonobacteraceae bacterium]